MTGATHARSSEKGREGGFKKLKIICGDASTTRRRDRMTDAPFWIGREGDDAARACTHITHA